MSTRGGKGAPITVERVGTCGRHLSKGNPLQSTPVPPHFLGRAHVSSRGALLGAFVPDLGTTVHTVTVCPRALLSSTALVRSCDAPHPPAQVEHAS